MPEARKSNTRPLALTIQQQQQLEHNSTNTAASATDEGRKRRSTLSNGTPADPKSTSSRRRSGIIKAFNTKPSMLPSSSAARSTTSPNNMSTINYTKTGRVSKAKKGLKVHDCECGRSYTRAEHLRRHQRNHAQEDAMICKYPSCGKTFFRSDLLQRHEERHNELGNASRRSSVSSAEHSAHASPRAAPPLLPEVPSITPPPALSYAQQRVVSPQPDGTPFPRYTPNLFRAPKLPRTPKIAPFSISNHHFHPSQNFKSSSNDLKHQNLAYPSRHSISGPIMIDGTATNGVWHDSFAQSPYSCSSGYASPAPGPEYGNIYATPPYIAGVVRTRASSNASFIEQTWAHGSQSPTSSATIPYSWSPDEKNILASSFPFVPVSYSTSNMSAIDTLSHYTHYDPQDMVQMDNEEGLQLFPGEHYGMSQIARAYPFEQWLNNYWRLFHPTFPIVHRYTFACRELSPMLYAAMIAIDLQYSNDSNERHKAWELHRSCNRLLLQRERMGRTGCDRLCDIQAIFLVEVFSQYCARRCSKAFSARFELMYEKVAGIRSLHPSAIFGLQLFDPAPEETIKDRWIHWTNLSARQHLLLSCYVLEFQQSTLLARHRQSSLQSMSDNLPFPAHQTLWDAKTASEWATIAQRQQAMPMTVQEALQPRIEEPYDIFQSAVLIATCHGQSIGPASTLSETFEHLLSQSSTTQIQLLTSKLAQLLPTRALLAVSGESWVFGTKLTSTEEWSALRSSLHAWIGQLWSSNDNICNPTAEALRISVAILQLSLKANQPLALGLGNELGLFFAALVLWAATVSATSRMTLSSLSTPYLQPPVVLSRNIARTSRVGIASHTAHRTTDTESTHHQIRQNILPIASDRNFSVLWMEIFSNASRFLSTAIDNISALELAACHTGCTNLLLWVEMHLRGAFIKQSESSEMGVTITEHHRGELINEALGQIQRMLHRGWEGWGI